MASASNIVSKVHAAPPYAYCCMHDGALKIYTSCPGLAALQLGVLSTAALTLSQSCTPSP